MSLTRKLFLASILMSIVSLVLGYGLRCAWTGTFLVVFWGIAWGSGQRHRWRWLTLATFSSLITAAFGFWINLSPLAMVLGMVTALSAWDLGQFESRLKEQKRSDDTAVVERDHIRRLAVMTVIGFALAIAGTFFQLNLHFGLVVLLILIMVWSISRVIDLLQREAK